jgi:hypothetical protein
VKIIGEDIQSWGGQIVTSDTIEGDMTMRMGQLIMDNVEVYNCSQANTLKAAVRFEGASGRWSSVTNSAIHSGLGWGLGVYKSANVHIANNVIWGFKPIGVGALTVRNFTLDGNFVGHITERDNLSGQSYVDRRGAVALCSLEGANICSGLNITNNIVGGASFHGFALPADDCNSTQANSKFWNNIAHSIAGHKGGNGAFMFADPSAGAAQADGCLEMNSFASYKVTLQGAFSFGPRSKYIVFNNITSIDNGYGSGAQVGRGADDEYYGIGFEMKDSVLMGESEIPDCPNPTNGDYCELRDKMGLFPFATSHAGKPPHPTGESALPLMKIKKDPAFGGRALFNRVKFANFMSAITAQGKHNTILGSSNS